MKKNPEKEVPEPTQEEFDELISKLHEFEEKFFINLAGSDRFEIIPTTTESGKTLTKEQMTLLKNECDRLGLRILYRVDMKDGMLIINPKTMKIGFITEGVH